MAIKELLVHLDQTKAAEVRLRLALDLAHRHGSRLTALFVDDGDIAEINRVPSAELHGGVNTAGYRLRSQLEQFQKAHGLEFEWCYVRDFALSAIKQAAHSADLCVIGQEGASHYAAADQDFSTQVVSATATPLLFVPRASAPDTVGRRIVVAWDSSNAATRAVNDAMPLIEQSDLTAVVHVDSGAQKVPKMQLDRIAERLRRHGAQAIALEIEPSQGRSVSDLLQAEARALGADLIVAGAFGHSRLSERLFGGVTRDLLKGMQVPLLMSH
jgi:nucleotide-binding universal stress UspA family protein